MRAQFVQIDPEFLTDALAVATVAGISRAVLIAGFVDLLNRSLTQETAHFTADQARGVFGCAPEPVLAALVTFGIVATEADGYRIRGWEKRYRDMLTKAAALDAARSKGGKASAKNLKRGAEKPTQGDLPGVEAPPKPPRAQSLQEQMHADFLASRLERLASDESEPTPDEPTAPAFVNASIGAFLRECEAAKVDIVDRWRAVTERFLGTPYYASRTPPYPFRMLAMEKTKTDEPAGWRRIWAELEAEARGDS